MAVKMMISPEVRKDVAFEIAHENPQKTICSFNSHVEYIIATTYNSSNVLNYQIHNERHHSYELLTATSRTNAMTYIKKQ